MIKLSFREIYCQHTNYHNFWSRQKYALSSERPAGVGYERQNVGPISGIKVTYLLLEIYTITPHLTLTHAWWPKSWTTYKLCLLKNILKQLARSASHLLTPFNFLSKLIIPKTVTDPSENKSTDGSDRTPPMISAAKAVNPRLYLRW